MKRLLWTVVVFIGLMVWSIGCAPVFYGFPEANSNYSYPSQPSEWWQDAYNALEEKIPAGLKAKVITSYKFMVPPLVGCHHGVEKFGEYQKVLDESLTRKCLYKYNEEGKIISQDLYKPDGSLDKKYIYQYDEKGNRVKLACYSPDGTLSYKRIYKYDAQSDKLTEAYHSEYKESSNIFHQHLYKYKDKKTEEFEYDSDGDLIRQIVYLDDEKGNRIETSWYNSDGSLNCKWVHKYDQKGNRIESRLGRNERLLKKVVYKYDSKGNKIEGTEYYIERKFEELRQIPVKQTTYTYEF